MKKNDLNFEKASLKSAQQIREDAETLKRFNDNLYEVRSNGNRIWVELGRQKHFWSPILRLQLANADGLTKIKGQFGESPLLWVIFLLAKLSSVGIFALSGVIAWYKYQLGYNFNSQLFAMFAMLSIWFAIYLISESYKRKAAGQIAELEQFVDLIAA